MTTETTLPIPTVAADAAGTVATPALTEQTPIDGGQASEQEHSEHHEETPDERIKRLERRLAKAHGNNGRLHQERQMLSERAAQADRLEREIEAIKARLPDAEPSAAKVLSEADIGKLADQRAREMTEAKDVQERASRLIAAGKTADGFDDAMQAIESDHELVANGKPTKLMRAFLSLDPKVAVQVMKHIADDPDVSDSLKGLSGFELGRRMLKIETEIAARPAKAAPRALTPEKPRGTTVSDQVAMSDEERLTAIRKSRLAA